MSSSRPHIVLPWAVRRTRMPLLARRCVDCGSGLATTGDGKFRVNANGKLLDVWLLVDCVDCNRTSKLTVHERVPVRSLDVEGYSTNSPALVASALFDPLIARRSHFTLVWDGCWELVAPPPPETPWPVQVAVTFSDPVPLRPDGIIAQGLGISRGEIGRRIKIDVPLNRKTHRDFSFIILAAE
jgi:hypothetical protein